MKRARVRLERALRLHCVKCFQARRISKDGGMRRMHTDRRNKQRAISCAYLKKPNPMK